MTDPAPLDARAGALLAHAPWVRRLARALVGEDRADDLAQDVWVRALGRPPAGEGRGSLRGWLRRVAVNRARELRRGETRRERRDREVARPEGVEDPLARLLAHRELVERVAELPEPWRRTILLRYFEELSLAAIAEREGVPLPTVNTRLRRGRELLREALGERSAGAGWLAALVPLPLTGGPAGPPAAPAGAGVASAALAVPAAAGALAAMKTALTVSAALVAAALAVYLSVDRGPASVASGAGEVAAPPALPGPLAGEAAPPPEPEAAAPARAERDRRPVALPSAPPDEAPAEPPALLAGRVIDASGQPMGGLAVWVEPDGGPARPLATTAGDGSFPLDPTRDLGRLAVRDARWGTVLGAESVSGGRVAPTLVVAPWIAVAGSVRAEEGTPLEGVTLLVAQPRSLRARVAGVTDTAVPHEPSTQSGPDGRFELERALAVEGAELCASADGFEDARVPLPPHSTAGLEIVLRRPRPDQEDVRGQVVDAAGRPIAGAWVSLGGTAVQTDEAGGFRLDGDLDPAPVRLVAAHPEHLPAFLERPRGEAGELLPWPSFVVLALAGTPLELSGRVVDGEGKGLAGWKVWPAGVTLLGRVDQQGVVVEGLHLGILHGGEEDRPTSAWPWTATDDQGRFRVRGLLERDYELELYEAESLTRVRTGPFPAGSHGIEIVLEPERLARPVAGRVVDSAGEPFAGVEVSTHSTSYLLQLGAWSSISWGDDGPRAITDEAGRFRFESLPRRHVALVVQHPDVMPTRLELDPEDPGDEVTLVCERRYHLRVETDLPEAASARVELFDAEGERVRMNVFSANGTLQTTSYPLVEGRCETLAVSGAVRELVLRSEDGTELRRVPVELVFGRVNLVRP